MALLTEVFPPNRQLLQQRLALCDQRSSLYLPQYFFKDKFLLHRPFWSSPFAQQQDLLKGMQRLLMLP